MDFSCDDVQFYDTCKIEWDAGYPYVESYWTADLSIYYRENNGIGGLFFEWSGSTREYSVSQFNNKINAWDQQYAVTSTDSVRRIRSKSLGNFILDDINGNPFYVFPLDSRRDCGEENQDFNDCRSGLLSLNLTIDRNVTTPNLSELLDFPTRVIVNPGVFHE